MADGTPGIDPRFAPEFQRGYDGPVATRSTHALADSTRAAPLRVADAHAASPARIPDPPPSRTAAVSDEELVDADEPESPSTARPRAEWALLVAAVILLILAAVLFQGSLDVAIQYQGVGPGWSEQVYALAAGVLPGPLMLAGVVALCLWIALRAMHPRRPR